MITARRHKGETFESLIRRFNRLVIKSGKLLSAKQKRFKTKEPNKRAMRESALRRLQNKGKFEYLKRIGKIEERRYYR